MISVEHGTGRGKFIKRMCNTKHDRSFVPPSIHSFVRSFVCDIGRNFNETQYSAGFFANNRISPSMPPQRWTYTERERETISAAR